MKRFLIVVLLSSTTIVLQAQNKDTTQTALTHLKIRFEQMDTFTLDERKARFQLYQDLLDHWHECGSLSTAKTCLEKAHALFPNECIATGILLRFDQPIICDHCVPAAFMKML